MGLSGPKSLLEVKPRQQLPGRDRDAGARAARAARRPAAAGGDELPVHAGAVAGGAAALRRPARARRCRWTSCRAASRSCARTTWRRWSGRRTRTSSGARPGTATSTPRWPPPGCWTTLLDAGLRWIFVSNSDNLGALADVRIAAWVADEEVPFAMEAVRGTRGRPQGRPPRPSRRPGGAAGDGAGARRRPVLRRRRPVALLQHEQPVGGPAGAQGPAGRGPGRPGAPADRQPQDRRPPRQDQHPR